MANRINVNGIELTREETFPTIAVAEPKVEETVVEEVKEEKVIESTVETEETSEVVEDEPTETENEIKESIENDE